MEWNSCASLHNTESSNEAKEQYKELLNDNLDPFAYMLQMQFDLQFALANKAPKNNPKPNELKTIGQKFDWIRENKQAFDDEYREVIDALPGMSLPDKERSAVWKKWKTSYESIRERTFDDMSKDELVELKMELVDSFHFFMNFMFALDMTAEEMFELYFLKNAENHRRAKNGY